MERTFSVFEALATGLQRVLDNFRLFFLASVTMAAIIIGCLLSEVLLTFWVSGISFSELQALWTSEVSSDIAQQMMARVTSYTVPLVVGLLGCVFMCSALMLGYIKMTLEVYDRGSSTISQLFSCFTLALKGLAATLLYVVIVGLASIFFVIPGIYLALRCILFIYFILDKNAGIIASLKQSYAATAGHIWPLFALMVVFTVVNNLGMVMMFFMMPVKYSVFSYVYRTLTARNSAQEGHGYSIE